MAAALRNARACTGATLTPRRATMIHERPWQRLAPRPQEAAVAGIATFSRGAPDRLRPEPIRASVPPLLVERRLA